MIIIFSILTTQILADDAETLNDVPSSNDTIALCDRCSCTKDTNPYQHFILDCSIKQFEQVIDAWPDKEIGMERDNIQLIVSFSGNHLQTLQQLPPSDTSVLFACRHCQIEKIENDIFINTPRILRIDLSWNYLTGDALRPEIFRGPYNETTNEPIHLQELNLSNNEIHYLDEKLFEHVPYLHRLVMAGNPLKLLETSTTMAISSLVNIEHLDLSYTELEEIPDSLFRHMTKLRELLLHGNKLATVPTNLVYIRDTLKSLYLGGNSFEIFDDGSFLGLEKLAFLNISSLPELTSITTEAFTHLQSLEMLVAVNNTKLKRLDLNSLKDLPRLRELDLRNCGLTTLVFEMDNTTDPDTMEEKYFQDIRKLKLENNPWHCDCLLLLNLKEFNYYDRVKHHYQDNEARCTTPYNVAGTLLSDLMSRPICKLNQNRRQIQEGDDPPRFLRRNAIVFTLLAITGVITIGFAIGFGIVFIKKKLNRTEDQFASPVRYTTVRDSHMVPIVNA